MGKPVKVSDPPPDPPARAEMLLWASDWLDVEYLPPDFAVPVLWACPIGYRWFWPVDLAFGVCFARRLAAASPRQRAAYETCPEYPVVVARLDAIVPGGWAACQTSAAAGGPASLPNADFPRHVAALAGDPYNLVPRWDGWAKLAAAPAESPPAGKIPLQTPAASVTTKHPNRAKPKQRNAPADSGGGLF
jgi:hypothetical protein